MGAQGSLTPRRLRGEVRGSEGFARSQVSESRPGAPSVTAYDPASNLTTATYPNGYQAIYTYDQLNWVTGLATQNSDTRSLVLSESIQIS
jgi:hypothetical protein